MSKNRLRGYPKEATQMMHEAFEEVEHYAINYAETDELISQLLVRLGDWYEDPDPSYDEFFAKANPNSLEMMHSAMKRCYMDQAKEK